MLTKHEVLAELWNCFRTIEQEAEKISDEIDDALHGEDMSTVFDSIDDSRTIIYKEINAVHDTVLFNVLSDWREGGTNADT